MSSSLYNDSIDNRKYTDIIPPHFHLVWSGKHFSYLRYLTPISFLANCGHFPITIHYYDPPDDNIWWERLYEIELINFKLITAESKVLNLPGGYLKDTYQYYILGQVGGLISDFDIFYFKNIYSLIQDADIVAEMKGDCIHFAFLASCKSSDFFTNIYSKTVDEMIDSGPNRTIPHTVFVQSINAHKKDIKIRFLDSQIFNCILGARSRLNEKEIAQQIEKYNPYAIHWSGSPRALEKQFSYDYIQQSKDSFSQFIKDKFIGIEYSYL